MERGAPGERYLVGACNLTVRELFGRLERLSGVPRAVARRSRGHGLSRAAGERRSSGSRRAWA